MTSEGTSEDVQGYTETRRPIMLTMKTKRKMENTLRPVETISQPLSFPESRLWEAENCAEHLPVPPQGRKP